MTISKPKSRLGKGLSALINAPVQVVLPPAKSPDHPTNRPPLSGYAGVVKESADPSASGLRSLRVASFAPNRFQPRQVMDPASLERLAESIRVTGVMQPIVVRPISASGGGREAPVGADGQPAQWEIIAGERRWRAATIAGLEVVPAIVSDIDDQTAAEWALVENLQREDLNPMDRATAFRGLSDRFGLTQADISARVGVERSTVANLMRLTELESELQHFVRSEALSTGHAKCLLSLPTSAERVKLGTLVVQEQWSVRRLEEHLLKRAPEATEHPATSRTQRISAGREALERQLGEHLGTKVRVTTNASGDKGKLQIDFYSVEHFDGLMDRLGFEMRS